jgi:DNA topoisomerase-1
MTRLRRSRISGPGIRRIRRGRGFSYIDESGAAVSDPALVARYRGLAVPPAWTDVWIAPHANCHIQATGIDAAGRRQYLYHPGWREQKDRLKFERMLALATTLPRARRTVTADLRTEGPSWGRALAGAFRMLDSGSLRVGSERYADEHGSYGLSTLLAAHATVHGGDRVELRFPGKSGQAWESEIRDADLAALVTELKRRGGRARLLAWRDDEGAWHPLRPEEINADIRRRTGGDFTAKDFRTLHGTVAAALSLARSGPRPTESGRRGAVALAIQEAAAVLGNTPAIARSSYVDPRLIDRYERGETVAATRPRSVERRLRELLSD